MPTKNEVYVKLLKDNAILPKQGSAMAAGYDLYAAIEEDIDIQPGTAAKIGTGLAITPPQGYFGAIFARSGLALKNGLRPANCIGACDWDYTGEYIVPLYNDSQEIQTIHCGDRIAQLIFLPYIQTNFIITDELKATDRGDGGFGSTGIN